MIVGLHEVGTSMAQSTATVLTPELGTKPQSTTQWPETLRGIPGSPPHRHSIHSFQSSSSALSPSQGGEKRSDQQQQKNTTGYQLETGRGPESVFPDHFAVFSWGTEGCRHMGRGILSPCSHCVLHAGVQMCFTECSAAQRIHGYFVTDKQSIPVGQTL